MFVNLLIGVTLSYLGGVYGVDVKLQVIVQSVFAILCYFYHRVWAKRRDAEAQLEALVREVFQRRLRRHRRRTGRTDQPEEKEE